MISNKISGNKHDSIFGIIKLVKFQKRFTEFGLQSDLQFRIENRKLCYPNGTCFSLEMDFNCSGRIESYVGTSASMRVRLHSFVRT